MYVKGEAATLDRKSPLPLWWQLSQDLLLRLGQGQFEQGFPSEHQLCDDYSVSRHTVREALRRLRDDGLLDSSRGRQTVVRQPRFQQSLGSPYSLFREMEARAVTQTSEILVRDLQRNRRVAKRLGVPEDERLVHLERMRHANGEPLALDSVWLAESVVGRALLTSDLSHAGLYDELERQTGVVVTQGGETIQAVIPNAEQQALLRLPAGAAALWIERVGVAGDTPVEYRETLVRGDRMVVSSDWTKDPDQPVRKSASGRRRVRSLRALPTPPAPVLNGADPGEDEWPGGGACIAG